MRKHLFLTLLTGITLILVACGHENNNETSSAYQPTRINNFECIIVEGNSNMDDFFASNDSELMNAYIGDLDAFFSNRINNYAGLFYHGSGVYVILFADLLRNWQTPEMLENVDFKVCQVEHSYSELAAVRTQIHNNYTMTSARITGWGISTLNNRVFVYLANLTDEVILDFRENVSDSPLIEFIESPSAVFNAIILEMHDEPLTDWYGAQMTVLVTSEEFGRMIFDHRRLEDIGATVGDIVELTITGDWEQPDPQSVHPDSWRLVDGSGLTDDANLTLTPSLPLRVNEALKDIELVVVNDVQWDSEFVELRLTNHTEHVIIYGEPFSIEFLYNGEWKTVQFLQDYVAFVDIGYILEPDEIHYFPRYLSWLFPDGLLRSGQYRFRMHIFNDAEIPIREHHLHDLVAEFYIE